MYSNIIVFFVNHTRARAHSPPPPPHTHTRARTHMGAQCNEAVWGGGGGGGPRQLQREISEDP